MSKDEMIYKLGELSRTPEHELISRMLTEYNVHGTADLSAEQIETFLDKVIGECL